MRIIHLFCARLYSIMRASSVRLSQTRRIDTEEWQLFLDVCVCVCFWCVCKCPGVSIIFQSVRRAQKLLARAKLFLRFAIALIARRERAVFHRAHTATRVCVCVCVLRVLRALRVCVYSRNVFSCVFGVIPRSMPAMPDWV